MVFGGVNSDSDGRQLPTVTQMCRALHRQELAKRVGDLADHHLDLLALGEEGFKDKQIAAELGISISAIAQRKQTICLKLGVTSYQTAIALYALSQWGQAQ